MRIHALKTGTEHEGSPRGTAIGGPERAIG